MCLDPYNIVKNGLQENRNQRYICRDCKKSFSIGDKRIRYDIILRKLTITLFLNGTSMRGIQKALSVSFSKKIPFHVVNDWLSNSNRILEEEKQRRKEKEEYLPNDNSKPKNIPIVEMDELFTYIKKTKKFNNKKTLP